MSSPPVVILDGNQRAALAAVRALGKKGIPVVVADHMPHSIAAASRFCQQSFLYPSPYTDPEAFISVLIEKLAIFPQVVLFPMTDVTLSEVLLNRKRFPDGVVLPFPGWEAYQKVSDKVNLFREARNLSVPMPETLFSDDFDSSSDMLVAAASLGYPLVCKAAFSRVRTGDTWTSTSVRYVLSEDDLSQMLAAKPFAQTPFVIQEKIEGPGVGVFVFMNNGELLSSFAHQRLREKPPSGGVSVLCQSIKPPAIALDAAVRILKAHEWTGVAMVEYKQDVRTGLPKLIEVNGRFWGSLQLAVASGVDFPFLLYAHALGLPTPSSGQYRVGLKSRWELGDLDHLLIRLKERNARGRGTGYASKARLIVDEIRDTFHPDVRHEVFKLNDPLPFVHELWQYFTRLALGEK